MCGIAGWIGPGRGWNAEEFRKALLRRGPDGSGVLTIGCATLVHTRLAILDLSEAGGQPMCWGEGNGSDGGRQLVPVVTGTESTAIVFNGEVYNFQELRARLEQKNDVFAGDSDTEVLLRLLSRDGAACLPLLAGMFAFCFWDARNETAILARDAYGIKPLYYRIDEGTLAFASEAEILRRQGDTIDACALQGLLEWGSVPEPETLMSAVRQIPAGHFLAFRANTGEFTITRWYQRPRVVAGALNDSGVAAQATRAALEESVRRHLVSDVPVGVFLSGGIDSTAVLAVARAVLGPDADIRTFSIGFEDPLFDESDTARRTAEYFGARHTEWRMTEEDGAAEIPSFLEAMDQPTLDGFNTWCVAKLASREGMKVVLSGLGGDEWFAGYSSFRQVPRFHRMYHALGPMRPFMARIFRMAPRGNRWRRFAEFLESNGTWLDAFHVQRGIFTPQEAICLTKAITGLAPPARFIEDREQRKAVDSPGTLTPAERVGDLELSRYMRHQLLRDSDVFSMAHGLELRVPLVDIRLADTLLSLPANVRLQPGKKLLLDAVPEIPEWVRTRPKQGFRFPFQKWMEGRFTGLLAEAHEISPVPLKSWYRAWTLAAALHRLHGRGTPDKQLKNVS